MIRRFRGMTAGQTRWLLLFFLLIVIAFAGMIASLSSQRGGPYDGTLRMEVRDKPDSGKSMVIKTKPASDKERSDTAQPPWSW